VILLDEIDRVAEHARGDIMGVLVELLDPEQNVAFTDHYLDYPFDLSEVLFIATANNTTNIATAVLDRLEPIQMPSYSDEEKIKIAKDYVLPELMRESGLTKENLTIDETIWPKLVRPLGYDAGIRSLERTINGVCRKVAHMIVEGKGKSVHIDETNIKEFVESY
jgi:ATP-dependent Lon protease